MPRINGKKLGHHGEIMLYDIERKIKKMHETVIDDEYRDLCYDLESFIIDMTFGKDEEGDAQRQSYLGKIELVGRVIDEKEKEKVFSRIRPVLLHLGIHESIKGFRLLESCVLEAARIASGGEVYQMKDVYPIVAKSFGITSHNCERLCRYACKGIVPSRELSRKYPFFDGLTHRTYEEVTVKELVDVLVRYVLLRCNLRSRQSIN